jgi:hypothetical protein
VSLAVELIASTDFPATFDLFLETKNKSNSIHPLLEDTAKMAGVRAARMLRDTPRLAPSNDYLDDVSVYIHTYLYTERCMYILYVF